MKIHRFKSFSFLDQAPWCFREMGESLSGVVVHLSPGIIQRNDRKRDHEIDHGLSVASAVLWLLYSVVRG